MYVDEKKLNRVLNELNQSWAALIARIEKLEEAVEEAKAEKTAAKSTRSKAA